MGAKVRSAYRTLRANFRPRHWIYVAGALLVLALLGIALVWVLDDSVQMTQQERAWTLIAACGLVFTSWLIDDSIKNLQALYVAIRRGYAWVYGPRWWLAVGSVVSSVGMYFIWLGFVLLGVVVLHVAPDTPLAIRLTVASMTGNTLISMTSILLLLQIWYVFIRWMTRSFAVLPHMPIVASPLPDLGDVDDEE
jgi:hypothetical protein